MICPDCGGTLVRISAGDVSEKHCLTCGSMFDTGHHDERYIHGG